MSSLGGIDLVIWSIGTLCSALKELRLNYERRKSIASTNGKICNVDIVVKDRFNRDIGFQKQEDGTYKIIADSSGLTSKQVKEQKKFINNIRRNYSYIMIKEELKKQGYQVVEEKEVRKDTIKLVARRWTS